MTAEDRSIVAPAQWLKTRKRLATDRQELAEQASRYYASLDHVPGTRLLSRPEWIPDVPVELDQITLRWLQLAPQPAITGREPWFGHIRSQDIQGKPAGSYSETLAALAPPAVFENRPVYRLLSADLTDAKRLTFCPGWFFDWMDVGEASAHELADAGAVEDLSALPLRSAVEDPCALERRPASTAISTLVIRAGSHGVGPRFLLHWRDPARVAHAGGLYQLVPVGIFQPTGQLPTYVDDDFNMWNSMVREMSEEILGNPEITAVDYREWDFYQNLASARRRGALQAHCLGLGVDPLSFATDILTVVVFTAEAFDELFGPSLASTNDEGTLVAASDDKVGMPFTASVVDEFATGRRSMQAAGLAALMRAWSFRDHLLSI